jgi:uncharacterized membrane protein
MDQLAYVVAVMAILWCVLQLVPMIPLSEPSGSWVKNILRAISLCVAIFYLLRGMGKV